MTPMITAAEGLPQEHHIPFSQLCTQGVQSSAALFFPEILLEIGA